MSEKTSNPRVATGIEGLDTILSGGLVEGSVYIIQGGPGGGKTILANQICFHQAAGGQKCIYFTLLSESHDQLLGHMKSLAFFDASRVSRNIYYESAYDIFLKEGLDGVLNLLYAEGQARDSRLLVVDGLFVIEESIAQGASFRRFINEIASLAHLTRTTVLLLTNSKRSPSSPEYTMVDGWFELAYRQVDYRTFRFLQVHKMRGSAFIAGQHAATLTDQGLTLYPRLESLPWPTSYQRRAQRLSTGVPGLDTLLHGGLEYGSASVIAGPTGIGKTTFGLHFLSVCTPAEPGIVFSFYENVQGLCEKAATMGIDLDGLIREGAVQVIWQPPVETTLDQLGWTLLASVRRHGVKRAFIDGVEALKQATLYPPRIGRFLTALTNLLRAEGCSPLFSYEVKELFGGEMRVQFGPVSAVAENLILLRYVELQSAILRTLTIMKARNSGFDNGIRRFHITDEGIRLGDVFQDVEDLQTGHAHFTPSGD